jgi:hypothetical protein
VAYNPQGFIPELYWAGRLHSWHQEAFKVCFESTNSRWGSIHYDMHCKYFQFKWALQQLFRILGEHRDDAYASVLLEKST